MNWHIAISPEGVAFRIEAGQELPVGWYKVLPTTFWLDTYYGKSEGVNFFNPDGSLKERFSRLPIYGD